MRRRREMSGFFDWVKGLLPQAPRSMLPALRPSQLPARAVPERRSLIEVIQSGRKPLIPFPQDVVQVLVRKEAERAPEPKQKVDWREIVPQGQQGATSDLSKFLKPSTPYQVNRYLHPDEWPFGEPPIWSATPWQMPTTYEVADFIQKSWDLPGMFERVLNQVDTPYWRRLVAESSHTGEPAVLDIDLVSDARDPRNDMARFLRIPDAIIELYGRQGPEGLERFTKEVLVPMIERVEKSLEVFRPAPALRGYFELEPDDDMNFWLRYKEHNFPQHG